MTFPIRGGDLTCGYGVRGPWAAGYHPGRDYRAAVGTPVFATAGGVVQSVGWSWRYGPDYGLLVVIQTGHVRHLYAHLSSDRVHVGEKVNRGERIGASGNSGRSTGPHLHYEERVYPYGYWDHRRPQFDLASAPLPTVDASAMQRAAKNRDKYRWVSLYKKELEDALRDNGRRVVDMGSGDTFGRDTRENTRRLQRLWYPAGDYGGIPGYRIIRRLGNRRDAWRTVR